MAEDKSNPHYNERNKAYMDALGKWVIDKLLVRGAYGVGTLKIKVLDGIIQEVVTERESKLKLITPKGEAADDNGK